MPKLFASMTVFALTCGLLLLNGQPAQAWGAKTHKKMTSDAYHIMPKAFREFLGEAGGNDAKKPALKPLLEASVEPDSTLHDFQNHVFHIHGFKMGNGPFKIEEMVKEITTDIQKKAPRAQIIQKLGWLAHYVEDLAQPLHTGVATWEGIEEKSYHAKLEKDATTHVYELGVYFDGAYVIDRVSARMVYEALWANQYYGLLESAYTDGKHWQEGKPVLVKAYSRGVNNVVDVWYTIWVRSGGRTNPKVDEKPKYYPPFNSKKPAASLPHHSLIDEGEAPAEQPASR